MLLNKHRYLIYLMLLIIVFIVAMLLITTKNNKDKDTSLSRQESHKTADYSNITPGKSTEQDVKNVFGTPEKVVIKDSTSIQEYSIKNNLQKNSFVITDGKVTFIKRIISSWEKFSSQDIKNQYGEPRFMLYEKYPNSVFNLYIYPENGLAYLGAESGNVIEIWYFTPTDFNNFKELYATDYLEQKPIEKGDF